jgi:CheY-like chemotaxis protein
MQLPAAEIVASLEAQDGGPGRVIVCEPNPDAAEAIAAPLRGRGIIVEVVADLEAMIEAVARVRPHAIFVAVDRAPERVGAALRRLGRMTTARDWLLVGTGDAAAGPEDCDLYLRRPIAATQLDEVLSRCLAPDPP